MLESAPCFFLRFPTVTVAIVVGSEAAVVAAVVEVGVRIGVHVHNSKFIGDNICPSFYASVTCAFFLPLISCLRSHRFFQALVGYSSVGSF